MKDHFDDPVGRFIEGNSPTGDATPDGTTSLEQMIRAAIEQQNSSHNCYGTPVGQDNGAAF
ncbi:hypothetical protein ISP15_17955 [Dyella jejuensis]|uniref:Uncharacterized protein n=1 Tax=Dyella jejuensis TaxID=1432009 RepID=A0ABW8JPN7_9GAMM